MPELHSQKLFENEGIRFIEANLETDKIEGKYDVCLLTDVLEHFNYNPLPVLKKLRKVSGGIIITTPSRELDYVMPETAKYADLINWKMIPEKKKGYDFVDSHHHTYTKWELKELLSEAGFKVVHTKLLPVERTWVMVGIWS